MGSRWTGWRGLATTNVLSVVIVAAMLAPETIQGYTDFLPAERLLPAATSSEPEFTVWVTGHHPVMALPRRHGGAPRLTGMETDGKPTPRRPGPMNDVYLHSTRKVRGSSRGQLGWNHGHTYDHRRAPRHA